MAPILEIQMQDEGCVFETRDLHSPIPFHSADVLGMPGVNFNALSVSNVAAQIFGQEKWGPYLCPIGTVHSGKTIKIPGMTHKFSPNSSNMGGCNLGQAVMHFTRLEADPLGRSVMRGAVRLHAVPHGFEHRQFDVMPRIQPFTNTASSYPALHFVSLTGCQISGPVAPGASNTLSNSIATLSKTTY